MSKSIRITVPFDSSKGVTVETEGFSGSGCQAATQAIEAALGKTVSVETTDEFLKPMTQEQHALQ
ncbi:MAG: DUF2997 domain-containing protein, partial [Phycisphaerae bacterium]